MSETGGTPSRPKYDKAILRIEIDHNDPANLVLVSATLEMIMLVKTSDLTGRALDWAVAKCDKRTIGFNLGGGLEVRGRTEDGAELPEQWDLWMPWHPSTRWDQGGPIIEREGITISKTAHGFWEAYKRPASTQECYQVDGSPIVAAMRCFVASKLGDTVEVPDELLETV